jgi:hypothetical protein
LSTAPDNNAAANGQAEFIDTLEMKHHLDNNKEIKKFELECRVYLNHYKTCHRESFLLYSG